ncbi:hypothetical protein [Leisingera daeponensis]|uniref:hypothetical protein n=1 Tax=Leisingera daeponensis TaxID=405746 RepID=UPI001C960AE7|nr:hypothetical protein [Leisingera daeponensis]MBY6058137.1 hypothetical protein [Leisingera daeponensis]
MLKLKADAQPAGEPGIRRGAAIRIDGVSAPKNIKIGLVAAGCEVSAASLKGTAASPSKAEPVAKAANSTRAAGGGLAAVAGRITSADCAAATGPQPLSPAAPVKNGAIAKLALAAAGLAVASAMLLYFQFGGSIPETDAQATTVAAAEVPAGAAAAAGLEGAAASGEDALVARITQGTLAALRSKQGSQPAPMAPDQSAAAAEGSALYNMVLTAAAQGQSEAYIDQLVNGAYERQDITVPASLIGADGRVDTATLLALFIGR